MIHALDDITPADIDEALDLLGQHVPLGMGFGRPVAARWDDGTVQLATVTGWAWVSADRVERFVPLDADLAELVVYKDGVEVSRTVGPAR
jgi:hypothetical protein